MISYEAIIWDSRDKECDEPSSTLGTFDTREDALDAIKDYLAKLPMHTSYIYKMEVVEVV